MESSPRGSSPGAQGGGGSVPWTAQPRQQDSSTERTPRQFILQQVEHGRDSKTKDIKETKKGGGGDTGCNKDCNKGGEQTLYEKHKEAFH